MKKKIIIYIFLAIFIIYTLYKIVIIYILNISSLNSHYTYHSKSIEVSNIKGLYVASYSFDKSTSKYDLVDSLIPKELFLEKEKVIYPQYYFYWGKSEISKRLTMNGSVFLGLSESGKYDISCPLSTLPYEKENIDKYRGNIYFFFKTTPSEIIFLIYENVDKSKTDTLVYKKI